MPVGRQFLQISILFYIIKLAHTLMSGKTWSLFVDTGLHLLNDDGRQSMRDFIILQSRVSLAEWFIIRQGLWVVWDSLRANQRRRLRIWCSIWKGSGWSSKVIRWGLSKFLVALSAWLNDSLLGKGSGRFEINYGPITDEWGF